MALGLALALAVAAGVELVLAGTDGAALALAIGVTLGKAVVVVDVAEGCGRVLALGAGVLGTEVGVLLHFSSGGVSIIYSLRSFSRSVQTVFAATSSNLSF